MSSNTPRVLVQTVPALIPCAAQWPRLLSAVNTAADKPSRLQMFAGGMAPELAIEGQGQFAARGARLPEGVSRRPP